MKNLWKDSVVLLTGGTGSFGKVFSSVLLKEYAPRKLIIFSRDELKQYEMKMAGFDHPSIRYFIGDVRDSERLHRAMKDVDVVVHAAALKQVPACEYNPFEAVQTNIMGAKNIINAAIDCGVKRVVALSTDKAASPANLYGATKLVSEKLFTQGNSYSGNGPTRFSCVRYGNVVGSRGSVVPLFMKQKDTGRLTVTDPRMTRFWITLQQGVNFVLKCGALTRGGEVFIPKLPSMNIMDLCKAIAPDAKVDHVGIRPGEKLHETLISEDEARSTVEFNDHFAILPLFNEWEPTAFDSIEGKKCAEGFSYSSDNNKQWLTVDEMKNLIRD